MSLTVIRPLSWPVAVDDRQLLDLVPPEQELRVGERRPDGSGDEVLARHQLADQRVRTGAEAEVAVGEDADEHAVGARDRHARDAVARHQVERVGDQVVRAERHRLDDHAGLAALHLVDLGDLVLDRQVPVDDPDPALPRERDRERRPR